MTTFPDARRVNPGRAINNYDCGCLITRDPAGATTFHACLMHNAAPDLLASLTELVNSPNFKSNNMWDRALNALRKAGVAK